MNTGKQMYKEIARHTSSEITVIPPPEKLLRIPGLFGHTGQVFIPINGFRTAIGRHGILPGTIGTLTIGAGFNAIQLTNISGTIEFSCFGKFQSADTLTAHLHRLFGLLPGIDHPETLIEFVHHGLLTIHMRAAVDYSD